MQISLEYLELCQEHAGTTTMQMIQTHVRHFIDHQWSVHTRTMQKLSIPIYELYFSGRRPWFSKFRNALSDCRTVADIDRLLRYKVQRWRALSPLSDSREGDLSEEGEDGPNDRDAEHLEDPEVDLSYISLLS